MLDNTLEHLNEPMKVLEEVNRILKDGGECISVPYFRSKYAFCDPAQKSFLHLLVLLDILIQMIKFSKNFRYKKNKFKIKKIEINKNQKNNIFMFKC